MAGNQQAGVVLLRQLLDQLDNVLTRLIIKAGGWFIGQN
jgi:hypothetical protein